MNLSTRNYNMELRATKTAQTEKRYWMQRETFGSNFPTTKSPWILSAGTAYRNLELAKENLSSPLAPGSRLESLDGWSHMMRTSDKKWAFLYFENKAVSKYILPNRWATFSS